MKTEFLNDLEVVALKGRIANDLALLQCTFEDDQEKMSLIEAAHPLLLALATSKKKVPRTDIEFTESIFKRLGLSYVQDPCT